MSIPGNHVRFVFGASNVGGEKINTGFWVFLNSSPPTQSDLDTLTTDAATLWNSFTGAIQGFLYTGVTWANVNSYYYDGTSDNAALQSIHALTANTGTVSTNGGPIDQCLVVSLRTGLPGRNRRGRMYIPYHTPVLAASGNTSSTNATTMATAAGTLLNGWSAAHVGWAAVVSRTSTQSRPVTQVQVDTKPDIQRRRENKLVASSTALVTITP